ncbi:hypothetical protein [Labilibaculum sp.]|uniref:hypothetical protein n=1 Tax=Labilibaculum sp. TaxID=2060723 RepID=UPI0035654C1B
MKSTIKLCTTLALTFLLFLGNAKAQSNYPTFSFDNSFTTLSSRDSTNIFSSAFTYVQIGGKNYLGLRFQPDINFGKIGIGLEVPFYFNLDDGKLYSNEFKNGSGIFRLISYLRYGRKKQDRIYLKLGQLQGEALGYGSLLNNYGNSPSFEKRKVGLSYDIRIQKIFGVEGLYSDFNFQSLNLLAIRPYVRPFSESNIPIVKTLDFGFSFITDKDQTTRFGDESGSNEFLSKGIKAFGFDMGILILNTGLINLTGYAHYSRLSKVKSDSLIAYLQEYATSQDYNAGKGTGIGLNANMNIIGNLFRLNSRIERLWYSDNYTPQFFDAIYEVNKDAKIAALGNVKKQQGIYASISASLLDKIMLGGNLLLPDKVSKSSPASLQLNLRTPNLFNKIIVEGYYTKGNLTKIGDSFTFDENSLALLRFAYKISPILVSGIDYRWAWSEQDDGSFQADKSIMPYLAFRFQF